MTTENEKDLKNLRTEAVDKFKVRIEELFDIIENKNPNETIENNSSFVANDKDDVLSKIQKKSVVSKNAKTKP